MARITFRTADGRKVTFDTKRNPSSKRKPAKKASRTRSGKPRKGVVPPQLRPYLFKKKSASKRKAKKSTKKAKRCSPARASCVIPKGKRKGDEFTKAGIRYRVVSYMTADGKRVRYAARVK